MTPQEQQLIDGLIDRIRNTPVQDKDDEADRYIHQQLDKTPDALYVLAQTVLVQQYGLDNAQKQIQDQQDQIDDLQQQLANAQPKKSGSFLSHLLGTDQQPQQAPPPPQQVPYQPVNTGYPGPPPPSYGYGQPVVYAQQPMGYGSGFGSGSGGFLRGALQTAAGVAAGEMVFRGMEDMFSGFGSHEHLSGGQPTEVINNNYYGDEGGSHEHHAEASSGDGNFYNPSDDASRQGLSPDIEDRRGFADSGNDNSGDQQGFADTGNDDTANYDDSGNFDDSGSYDDGGGFDGGGGDDGNY